MTNKHTLAEAIRQGWHEGGFYGRADLAPGWLDGLASITADALLPVVAQAETEARREGLIKGRGDLRAAEHVAFQAGFDSADAAGCADCAPE